MTPAKMIMHNLNNSDGSALYTSPNGTHVLQSTVHYPLEVPFRSDEIPNDTYIEVSIRPHNSVAMVKERHLEQIVGRVLKSVILGEETPRCMLQVTIQVMQMESDQSLPGGVKGGGQGEGYLDTLVGAVNVSSMGCLDGGVQMKGLVGAVLVGVVDEQQTILSPNVGQRKGCRSLHTFAFTSRGECVLMESEGRFHLDDWTRAENVARKAVCGDQSTLAGPNGDIEMANEDAHTQSLFQSLRQSVEERMARDQRWKQ